MRHKHPETHAVTPSTVSPRKNLSESQASDCFRCSDETPYTIRPDFHPQLHSRSTDIPYPHSECWHLTYLQDRHGKSPIALQILPKAPAFPLPTPLPALLHRYKLRDFPSAYPVCCKSTYHYLLWLPSAPHTARQPKYPYALSNNLSAETPLFRR